MNTATIYRAHAHSVRRSDRVLWGCGLVVLLLAAIGIADSQTVVYDDYEASDETQAVEFPAMSQPAPTAEGFQAINDGRVPPGEAIIGINEIRPQNCPNGQCPAVTYTNYAPPANYAPAPAYPAGYSPPAYSPPQYSLGDCDCENCNCRGQGRRFPVARAAVRVSGRVITAPFRWIRNRRGC
jgi:hypothetical protein